VKPFSIARGPRSRDEAEGCISGSSSQGTAKPIILVVDDEPDSVDILQWFLRDAGFVVRTAANGSDALRSVQTCVPDLAVIDYMMPGMNGVVLCRRLREQPATQQLPIILHTGTDLSVEEANHELCVDRVVKKPSDVLDLVEEVRELLDRTH